MAITSSVLMAVCGRRQAGCHWRASLFNVSVSMLCMVPLPWTMIDELFPPQSSRHDGRPGSVAIRRRYFFIFFTVKMSPSLMTALATDRVIWLFAAAATVAACLVAAQQPETRGMQDAGPHRETIQQRRTRHDQRHLIHKGQGQRFFGGAVCTPSARQWMCITTCVVICDFVSHK